MPGLNTKLHLKMFENFKHKRKLLPRIFRAIKREFNSTSIYGLEWGDPDFVEPLKFIRDQYVLPYINSEHCAVEIGPGGGRWTRYMLDFKKLYVVDYHQGLLEELKKNVKHPSIEFVKNDGTDFPGIKKNFIDYLFSFGTFVHLDSNLIKLYLENMKPILKPGANVVIQYSDKTKVMARMNKGFSQNTPEIMRKMVLDQGFKIQEEDLTTLWHSSIIRFGI
jgi:ubiquinone/menaquinone biosynthesis C-methylase UbiE